MSEMDRSVWRCDPSSHNRSVSYDEVTRLLQGYIENEIDMNRDQTCRYECSDYENAKSEGCYKDEFCARQPRCSGKLHDCQYQASELDVCLGVS